MTEPAGQFTPSHAGQIGKRIDSRPSLAIVALDHFAAIPGRFDEFSTLFDRQRAALLSNVHRAVQSRYIRHRVTGYLPAFRQPFAELLKGLAVVVVRLGAKVVLIAEVTDKDLGRVRINIAEQLETASIDHGSHPRHRQANMLERPRLADHAMRLPVPADRRVRAEPPERRIGLHRRGEVVIVQLVGPVRMVLILSQQVQGQCRSQRDLAAVLADRALEGAGQGRPAAA